MILGDYTSFIPGWIRNGHAYLLVFSLTDRHGFDMLVETFIPQIKQVSISLSYSFSFSFSLFVILLYSVWFS